MPFFYGWLIVAVATLGICFSIPGQTMGVSVFTDILMEELGLTRLQLSSAYCVGTMVSGFSLPWLGRVFDVLGARKMVVYSSLVTGLVLFYLSQMRRLLDLGPMEGVARTGVALVLITLGFYLIRASAQGVLTMSCRNVMGKWFDFHRGTALALGGVGTSFAFSVAPNFLDALIEKYSWSGAWMVLGGVTIVVMGGLGWLLVRDNPEECGLVMDGDISGKQRKVAHADSITYKAFTRAEALRTWAFWAFNLTLSFFSIFSTAYTFNIVSIAAEAGLEKSTILSYFFPMAVVSVLVNLAFGWVSGRMRLKYLLFVMNVAAVVGVLGLLYVGTTVGMAMYILGNGVCGGAFMALGGIVWPRFFGRKHLGAISGVAMSSLVLASAAGPVLFALAFRVSGSYAPALWASLVIPLVMAVGSFWADNPQRKFEGS